MDTGGTFTDCIAHSPNGKLLRLKILSSSVLRLKIKKHIGANIVVVEWPLKTRMDFLAGFTVSVNQFETKVKNANDGVIELAGHAPADATALEITTHEEVPVFATRLLTQTGLRESFPNVDLKLGSTRGTNALLEKKGASTVFIITQGFKDLLLIGTQQRPDLFALNVKKQAPLYRNVIETDERIDAEGSVMRKLTKKETDRIIRKVKQLNAESVAVAFMNSYKNPVHEQYLEKRLRAAGLQYVSLSHHLSPTIKILPRAETAVVNAYLHPIISQYVSRIQNGLSVNDFAVMTSAGGLMPATTFHPKDSLLSGPAGGVIGALMKGKESGVSNIVTFDMGGTSTDVSLCNGKPGYRFECKVDDLRILSPSLAIETIAAGVGSICSYDGHKLSVGPQSAGANPGPACYGKGGPLTITDVNLLLGRVDEQNFSIPLKVAEAQRQFQALLKVMKGNPDATTVLKSLVQIANEMMADAIRKVSIEKGFDAGDYALLTFGGAGGQHACAIAEMLNIRKVLIPYDAGLLSAYGIGQAQVETVKESLVLQPLSVVKKGLKTLFQHLFRQAKEDLLAQGHKAQSISVGSAMVFLRLKGQETPLQLEWSDGEDIERKFYRQYKKIYGHYLRDRPIEVESIRLVAVVKNKRKQTGKTKARSYRPVPYGKRNVFTSKGWQACPFYQWETLSVGASVPGPAMIISNNSTLFVDHQWSFSLDHSNTAVLSFDRRNHSLNIAYDKSAALELYTNRFRSIVDDMGAILQRTSFSVNVKERLDFSCALLDSKGELIVNAPHIPVHLGSLGVCVREVTAMLPMTEGDVVITNHPGIGGSHLPDVTLIKPVFYQKKLIAFLANRAHHAEIGGIRPGSMPANATVLEEEGVVIEPCFLMKKGKPCWDDIGRILLRAKYPTRSIHENLADFNGALASLMHGEQALLNLVAKHGCEEALLYMSELKRYASSLLQQKLQTVIKDTRVLIALEQLDDGSKLKVRISRKEGITTFDFTGSSKTHTGNLNATKAIVNSVVLYVLRLLANESIPLNEGLLENVKIVLPHGSILNPVFTSEHIGSPAVVGGNTEISQRLTDTVLKALQVVACSQGTMNNFLFGNDSFGYYETICGGTGAGPGFNGADAVHQHMTNTRITDPEIIEQRYPVSLERFEIRKKSGGQGKWKGGNGVVREFLFKDELSINILSQHRTVKPYGMKGGGPGLNGKQYIISKSGRIKKLNSIDGTTVHKGDRLVIKTPGGGGWGRPAMSRD